MSLAYPLVSPSDKLFDPLAYANHLRDCIDFTISIFGFLVSVVYSTFKSQFPDLGPKS